MKRMWNCKNPSELEGFSRKAMAMLSQIAYQAVCPSGKKNRNSVTYPKWMQQHISQDRFRHRHGYEHSRGGKRVQKYVLDVQLVLADIHFQQ